MRICILGRANYTIVARRAIKYTERGHDVHVITLHDGKISDCSVHAVLKDSGLPSKVKYLAALPKVKSIINQLAPDIIDIHGVSSYGIFALNSINIPLVTTIYGPDLYQEAANSWILRYISRNALSKSDVIIGSTAAIADYSIDSVGMDISKCLRTRRGGVDILRILGNALDRRTQIRSKLGVSSKTRVILHSRHLTHLWRVPILVESIPAVLASHPDSELWLAYPNPNEAGQQMLAELRRRVRELKLEEKVRFLGQHEYDDMISIMHASDIFVCIGTHDLLASSIQEALCTGLIPILSDLPAYREVIEQEKNGFYLNDVSPNKLAEQLNQVIANFESIKGPLADKNQALIRTNFNLEDGIDWLISQYQLAIEKFKNK